MLVTPPNPHLQTIFKYIFVFKYIVYYIMNKYFIKTKFMTNIGSNDNNWNIYNIATNIFLLNLPWIFDNVQWRWFIELCINTRVFLCREDTIKWFINPFCFPRPQLSTYTLISSHVTILGRSYKIFYDRINRYYIEENS